MGRTDHIPSHIRAGLGLLIALMVLDLVVLVWWVTMENFDETAKGLLKGFMVGVAILIGAFYTYRRDPGQWLDD